MQLYARRKAVVHLSDCQQGAASLAQTALALSLVIHLSSKQLEVMQVFQGQLELSDIMMTHTSSSDCYISAYLHLSHLCRQLCKRLAMAHRGASL